jgi:hypothetical protein
MKKSILILVLAVLSFTVSYAQKKGVTVEVLYFKANLSCCKAATCNALEGKIKTLVEENYAGKNVVFTEVKLADEANAALVAKYSAESQTVVIVKKRKGKETFINVSDIVSIYNTSKDEEMFNKDFKAKMDEVLN